MIIKVRCFNCSTKDRQFIMDEMDATIDGRLVVGSDRQFYCDSCGTEVIINVKCQEDTCPLGN